MTIDYAQLLTKEQKESILLQRIAQIASEAYQQQLNLELNEKMGNEAGVRQCRDSLEVLEQAIALHQAELAKLAE